MSSHSRLSPAAVALLAAATGFLAAQEPRPPQRYCNPLPIPNFPLGKFAAHVTKGEPNDGGLWLSETK